MNNANSTLVASVGRRKQLMAGKRELLRGGRLLVPYCALLLGLLGAGECFAHSATR